MSEWEEIGSLVKEGLSEWEWVKKEGESNVRVKWILSEYLCNVQCCIMNWKNMACYLNVINAYWVNTSAMCNAVSWTGKIWLVIWMWSMHIEWIPLQCAMLYHELEKYGLLFECDQCISSEYLCNVQCCIMNWKNMACYLNVINASEVLNNNTRSILYHWFITKRWRQGMTLASYSPTS